MDTRAIYRQLAGERISSGQSVISRDVARARPHVPHTTGPYTTPTHEQGRASKGARCPRCGKTVTGPMLLVHATAEEYVIELIKRDHPEWVEPDGTCSRCETYSQVLVEQTGV